MRYSKVFLAMILMFVLIFGSSVMAFATFGGPPNLKVTAEVGGTAEGRVDWISGKNPFWQATISASPNTLENYFFTGWKEKTGNTWSDYTGPEVFKLTKNREFKACFEKKFELTINVHDDSMGSVSGSSEGLYLNNSHIDVYPSPNTGFKFDYWTLNGVNQGNSSICFNIEGADAVVDVYFTTREKGTVTLVNGNEVGGGNPVFLGTSSNVGNFHMGESFSMDPNPMQYYYFDYYEIEYVCPDEDMSGYSKGASSLFAQEELVEVPYPYPMTLEMDECDMIVTFYYYEAPKKEITVRYHNTQGNPLVIGGVPVPYDYPEFHIGFDYEVEPKTFTGFNLIFSDKATGFVDDSEEEIVVTFVYAVPEVITEIITETITNTITETVFVPAPTQPVVIEEEETPLGVSTFTDIDAFLAPPTLEAVVEVEEEETPLADALPTTGQLPVELFYGAGGLISAVGVMIRRKKK